MKEKQIWIGVVVVIIIVLIGWYVSTRPKQASTVTTPTQTATSTVDTRVEADSNSNFDLENGTYNIEGQSVTLSNGMASGAVASSSATVQTAILEEPAFADLNGDGVKDAVVILRQNTGGSGIFYYTAAVLTNGTSTAGVATPALLLGDRIHIQSISIDSGVISITILDRLPTEPFSNPPTTQKTLTFTLKGTTLVPGQ